MAKASHRDSILDAGLKVMFRKGYVGAGVRDIVLEAGAPQGSFTNHFRSKETFAGEVLERQVSTNGRVNKLEAFYDVVDGDRSFTALVHGGTDVQTGAALLDGVILAGWRTGDRVHVQFQVMTNCVGAPLGRCFQGTIQIGPHGDD